MQYIVHHMYRQCNALLLSVVGILIPMVALSTMLVVLVTAGRAWLGLLRAPITWRWVIVKFSLQLILVAETVSPSAASIKYLYPTSVNHNNKLPLRNMLKGSLEYQNELLFRLFLIWQNNS